MFNTPYPTFASVTDVAASRALNTVYQNTTIYPKFVVVGVGCNGVVGVTTKVGAADPPATTVSYQQNDAGINYRVVCLMVPPEYYYKIETSGAGAPSKDYWTEAT